MKSDIEIARETDLRKIKEVATTLGIPRDPVLPDSSKYGNDRVSEFV